MLLFVAMWTSLLKISASVFFSRSNADLRVDIVLVVNLKTFPGSSFVSEDELSLSYLIFSFSVTSGVITVQVKMLFPFLWS